MISGLKRRVAKLESSGGLDVVYALPNGAVRGLHRSWLLRALHEAVNGIDSWQARVMLTAVSVNDDSRIHELAQALAAGPNREGEL